MNILFLCSPGLGSLDNWLPIIKELKKKNYNLDFYVPKESILDQIETNIFFRTQINIYFNNSFDNYDDYINFDIHRPGQDIRYALNDDKIRSLGWKPMCIFDNELKHIVEYYKNNFIW